jgi:hypothetical protein
MAYDLRHTFDLLRYLLPTPPVPSRLRRRMIALGAGSPTRAICSTLIAQAFQTINYPILPPIEDIASGQAGIASVGSEGAREVAHIRHYSLFVPRDFDISPYFRVVKPTIEAGFNHHSVRSGARAVPPASPALPVFPAAWRAVGTTAPAT